MTKLGRIAAMPPDDTLLRAHIERLMAMDVALQMKLRDMQELIPLYMETRLAGGSGLLMASTLRKLLDEYNGRWLRLGPHSLPTSFNVAEAFLTLDSRILAFDLRPEREHLLSVDHYFDWYTGTEFSDDSRLLQDAMVEGVIHSYDLTNDPDGITIASGVSHLRLLGISLVRHGPELSCMLVAGESPPFPADSDIQSGAIEFDASQPVKRELKPDPSLGISDRYCESHPGHSRVHLLCRFDLNGRQFDARYVNLDIGAGYRILTDDPTIFPASMPRPELEQWMKTLQADLRRYDELFATAASMLYMPLLFVDQGSHITELQLRTALHSIRRRGRIRQATRKLGAAEVALVRSVRCLAPTRPETPFLERRVDPPSIEFNSEGYWKPIPPGEIGADRDGQPVAGRTWVERIERWKQETPGSVLLSRSANPSEGNDPGTLYVMRSPSHGTDVYKIGITRRSADERAAGISSATGVPSPMEVLAKWEVKDCSAMEQSVHDALAKFRVSHRREFFAVSLSHIIATIESVGNILATK